MWTQLTQVGTAIADKLPQNVRNNSTPLAYARQCYGRIRIGFNADPDPAFKVNTGPDLIREHPALQNMTFFYFCGAFCPPGSGYSRPKSMRIRANPIPDPQH